MMRAITVYPEWAFAVLYLGKNLENRSWKPKDSIAGEWIALHAGSLVGGEKGSKETRRRMKRDSLDLVARMASSNGWSYWERSPGEYLLHDAENKSRVRLCEDTVIKGSIVAVVKMGEITNDDPVPWGMWGHHHWHFDTVTRLVSPVKCKGKVKLWTLPEDLAQSVARAVSHGWV